MKETTLAFVVPQQDTHAAEMWAEDCLTRKCFLTKDTVSLLYANSWGLRKLVSVLYCDGTVLEGKTGKIN